jgi:hypothetical protein
MHGMRGRSTSLRRICVVEQYLGRAVDPEYLFGRWASEIDRMPPKKACVRISVVHECQKVVFQLQI